MVLLQKVVKKTWNLETFASNALTVSFASSGIFAQTQLSWDTEAGEANGICVEKFDFYPLLFRLSELVQ